MAAKRTCPICSKPFDGAPQKRFCSPRCTNKASALRAKGVPVPTPAPVVAAPPEPKGSATGDVDVHAQLERAVARETAPPWERHPQPIDPRDIGPAPVRAPKTAAKPTVHVKLPPSKVLAAVAQESAPVQIMHAIAILLTGEELQHVAIRAAADDVRISDLVRRALLTGVAS